MKVLQSSWDRRKKKEMVAVIMMVTTVRVKVCTLYLGDIIYMMPPSNYNLEAKKPFFLSPVMVV